MGTGGVSPRRFLRLVDRIRFPENRVQSIGAKQYSLQSVAPGTVLGGVVLGDGPAAVVRHLGDVLDRGVCLQEFDREGMPERVRVEPIQARFASLAIQSPPPVLRCRYW